MNASQAMPSLMRELRDSDAVLGAVLFGSLARGEPTSASDIDLLVVREPSSSVDELRELVVRAAAGDGFANRVTPVFFTPDALLREFDRHPSFAAHLADEGVVVHSKPGFAEVSEVLDSPPITRNALNRELANRVDRLKLFSKLDRLNGEFVPCLAQLYSLGRSIVIVKLLENDIHEYSWRKVFDVYSAVRPDLDEDLDRVESLRVFYEHVRNRSELPSQRRRIEPEYVDDAIESIAAVAAS